MVGRITDANGNPVEGVTLRASSAGVELARGTNRSDGAYSLRVWTAAESVDLDATSPKGLAGWRPGVRLNPNGDQTVDLVLKPAIKIAGRATALDGKTPHASLVVELVQPAEKSEVRSQKSEIERSLPRSAGSAATNRVLTLDGSTNSFVELPTNLLPGAHEVTFEAWLKWAEIGNHATAFAIGDRSRSLILCIGDAGYGEAFGLLSEGVPIYPSFAVCTSCSPTSHLAPCGGGCEHQRRADLPQRYSGGDQSLHGGSFHEWPRAAGFPGLPALAGAASLRGEMDEVRLWRTARTPEQIRENIGRKLTGSEEGLVGLWNFDDPANPGRDASPGAHHGKLIGQATVTNAALPVIVSGTITDAAGKSLTNARVEIHQAGQPDRRVTANAAGEYAFTMSPAERCDLFVTTANRSAYRLGFQSTGESQQRLDWVLTEAGAAAAPGNTAATNGVLRLAGTNSFVELPQNLLAGARELTFEAWLKWDESDYYPTVFALGEPSQNLVFVMDTGNQRRRPSVSSTKTGTSSVHRGSAHQTRSNSTSGAMWRRLPARTACDFTSMAP